MIRGIHEIRLHQGENRQFHDQNLLGSHNCKGREADSFVCL